MKSLLMIFILVLSAFSYAETPLTWQKVELEERIANKIRSSVRNLMEPGQYLVEVQVNYTDPGTPKFDDLNKKGTKVSDIAFDDSKGDYIAFSKVGLEVPVVEDLYKDNQQKLKELHRYQESFDLFKNLDSVIIKVLLSDQVTPEVEKLVQNVVNNLALPTGDLRPEISYPKMAIEKVKIPPAPPKLPEKPKEELTLKDILNFISKFGNAIGLITATLLFGLVAWLLLKKWAELKKALDKKPEEEEKPEEEPVVEEIGLPEIPAETPVPNYVLKSAENFERLRYFLSTSPQEAQFMLKDWIANSSDDRQKALKAVVQQFTDEELAIIFKGLTDAEREKWRGYLESFLSQDDIDLANEFISHEVIRYMVDPSKFNDMELVDLLLGVSVDTASKFIVDVPDQGKVLMNLLNTQYSAKILNRLTVDQVDGVVRNALTFDMSEVKDGFLNFKNKFKEYLSKAKQKPFNVKIMQMMPEFNPAKEKMLYSFLAKSGMKDEMVKIAKDYLPLDLIKDLPRDLLNEIMTSMPTDKKVKVLLICEDELKQTLMQSFAEEGSNAREMLEIDFKNILSDPNGINRLQAQKDTILKDFLMFSRDLARAKKEYHQDIEVAINVWVDSMLEKPALRVVA